MRQLDFTVMASRNYIRSVVQREVRPKLFQQHPRSPSSCLKEEMFRRTNGLTVGLDSL